MAVQKFSVQTINKALRDMMRSVIEEHKKVGRPLVIWEDGKVVKISAREAELRLNSKITKLSFPRTLKRAGRESSVV